ncbi:MAG: hypothetical protein U9Q03_06075 [Patescibacteria group bacterium]|nr:hypothetical protein [Patescibacteria group bacterium]
MPYRRKTNRKTKVAVRARVWRRLDWVMVANIALAALILSLFVGYLMMNNRAATKGFAIRLAEKHIAELRDQGRKLDLEMVSVQAMENIDSHVSGLGFVPVSRVDYLTTGPAAVAVK